MIEASTKIYIFSWVSSNLCFFLNTGHGCGWQSSLTAPAPAGVKLWMGMDIVFKGCTSGEWVVFNIIKKPTVSKSTLALKLLVFEQPFIVLQWASADFKWSNLKKNTMLSSVASNLFSVGLTQCCNKTTCSLLSRWIPFLPFTSQTDSVFNAERILLIELQPVQ